MKLSSGRNMEKDTNTAMDCESVGEVSCLSKLCVDSAEGYVDSLNLQVMEVIIV